MSTSTKSALFGCIAGKCLKLPAIELVGDYIQGLGMTVGTTGRNNTVHFDWPLVGHLQL